MRRQISLLFPSRSCPPWKSSARAAGLTRVTCLASNGFTIVELLVVMALIVFLVTVVSASLVVHVEVLHDLDALGDGGDLIVRDVNALAEAVEEIEPRMQDFLDNTRETGDIDPEESASLREEYRTICAAA